MRYVLIISLTILSVAYVPRAAAQVASLSATTVSFRSQAVFTTGTPVNVTLRNTGAAPLVISSIATTGDFGQTNNCPTQLIPNARCTVAVSFTPQVLGLRTGTLTFTDSAAPGTQIVTLQGTGIAPVTFSPTSLSLGTVVVGVQSAPRTTTLSNNLPTPLTIGSIVTSGDFAVQSTTCGAQVASRGTCTISVTFTPTATGSRTGQIIVSDNATPSPQTVNLAGTGSAVRLTSIAISPASPTVPKTTTRQLQAIGSYNNNTTQDLTSLVSWTSSAPSIATIGNTSANKGFVTALQVGTSTITARLSPITSTTTLTVGPAPLTSIVVAPATASVAAGVAQQFTATGHYADGTVQDVTATAAWASSNQTVASVSVTGLAATATEGTANITASIGPVSGSGQLTVSEAALTSLSVAPEIVWVGVGSNRQYTATGTFTDGSSRNVTTSVIWSTSDAALATVDGFGLATSTGDGVATIIATAGTVNGSATMVGIAGGFVDCDARVRDMKALVVTNGRTEADFPAITQALEYLGTPYDVFDFSLPGAEITPEQLSNGCHGNYQGVFFTIAGWRYLINGVWNLDAYEHDFQVRHVNWFSFPDPNFGLNYLSGLGFSPTPYLAHYTPDAATIFPYANTANPIGITFAQIYLASAVPGATPLLTDDGGNVLAALYSPPWGSYQHLTLTFDSNQYLPHNLVLAYGLVNWAMDGVYLGERHVYLTPQIDDVFIEDEEWVPGTPCGTNVDATGQTFRIDAADWQNVIDWQTARQAEPTTADFVLHMAFNGEGTTGIYDPDDLTPYVQTHQAMFPWINHTFSHTNLDAVSYPTALSQIQQNNTVATALGLTRYSIVNMVTPDISGLTNPSFLQAAVDSGIRYLVTNTSLPGYDNPTPNTGIVNPIQPSILMIPRHPNNLFFNVATPEDWVAEYNCIYPQLGYGYAQIIDNISDSFIVNMLKGNMDPEMFHQPNLNAYDGTHTLLTDLLDATFAKYNGMMTLPILSPTQDAIGAAMAARAQYDAAGVTATLIPHQRISITAQHAATVPVTGLPTAAAETYGGQPISHVSVGAGQTVTLPLP